MRDLNFLVFCWGGGWGKRSWLLYNYWCWSILEFQRQACFQRMPLWKRHSLEVRDAYVLCPHWYTYLLRLDFRTFMHSFLTAHHNLHTQVAKSRFNLDGHDPEIYLYPSPNLLWVLHQKELVFEVMERVESWQNSHSDSLTLSRRRHTSFMLQDVADFYILGSFIRPYSAQTILSFFAVDILAPAFGRQGGTFERIFVVRERGWMPSCSVCPALLCARSGVDFLRKGRVWAGAR